MRSFAYTQIGEFLFYGYRSYVLFAFKKDDNHSIFLNNLYKVYPCSNFFEELRYAVSRSTNKIEIYSVELSSKEFIQLVKAAKKVKSLLFFDCKISFDSEFELGPMEGCQIEEIHITNINKVYDEWSEYEESLMNIFRGILKCTNLVRNLKGLNFKIIDDLKEKMIEEAKKILGEEYSEIMPSLKIF